MDERDFKAPKKWGGDRPGAGRPKQEPTQRVSVPVSLVDEVKYYILSRQLAAQRADDTLDGRD